MSDTVYTNNFKGSLKEQPVRVAFTRFWMGKQDGVQITIENVYVQMPINEFRKAVQAIEENVKETENAWWHDFSNVRLHDAGFKIRIRGECDSHFFVEALENHGSVKKGDKFLTLKLHCERLVKEPQK